MNFSRILAISVLLAALGTGEVFAQVFGNPLPFLKEGELAGGLQIGNFNRRMKVKIAGLSATGTGGVNRTTVRVSYGLDEYLGLDGYLGSLSLGPGGGAVSSSGTELGVVTRYGTGPLGKRVEGAATGAIYMGTLSGGSFTGSYTQIDAGFGGATKVKDVISAYAGLVLSIFNGSMSSSVRGQSFTTKIESDSLVGAYGGAEYAPDGEGWRVGAELHLIHESGFGLYGLLNF